MFQAVTFHLCKILNKILHHFFRERVNASDRADQNRRIIEVVRPFEPRRGSTLVEQPLLFCVDIQKTSDAFTLQPLKEYKYGDAKTVCP